MKTIHRLLFVIMALPLLLAADQNARPPVDVDTTPPLAAATTQASFSLGWATLSTGETHDAASPTYVMSAAVAPVETGEASSPLYGSVVITPGAAVACACDCHADPSHCNGLQDVTDVVLVVNVSFRGAAAIPDPNPACPYERTDTNCSGSTDVVDVVKMVNVAFRGGNPATEFCDPCP